MTKKCNASFHLPFLLLFFCLLIGRGRAADGPQVPGMFVFGSSLVDNGNNHFLKAAKTRADYFPYGIDLPPGTLGRFSNGKNVIDGLTDLLNLNPLPPFLDPNTKGSRIIQGVDFASGGSGILNETGALTGSVINLNQQITYFETVTLPDLYKQLNCTNKDCITNALSKYLFTIGVGGNDYMFNYFIPTGVKPTLKVFTNQLIRTLSVEHIQRLYNLGARKFILTSVYPLGCIPYVKSAINGKKCIRNLNKAAVLYNSKLKILLDSLKSNLRGSNLVYISSYQIIMNIIKNPPALGFKEINTPCCTVSSLVKRGNGVLCDQLSIVCPSRKSHVFFDSLHPTEAVNLLIAQKGYSSSVASEAHPINVQQLAKL